ncbi:MAG: indolepyruvate ferredoxin oxidoreductase family protein [Gammaproteobacteria bacterium]|nr:indolepyruvate ferredoxin oxidoreductase family protein [Gammaproteobacteria bacterium]
MARPDFSLDDRYTLESGVALLSGIHALARLPFDQRRLDARDGLNTEGYVSGYRGSPIGGLDRELWNRTEELAQSGIVFQPGVNEDLAATAIWGTQQVGLFPGARVDGVFALWYGKAPGLDRSSDAIRHANAAGSSPNGGVLLAVGDDPGCKSSTLPSGSEFSLRDLGVPTLAPSSVQEVLDFGLAGWALSRYSGCWAGLVTTSDTMDSSATALLPVERRFTLPDLPQDGNIRLVDDPLSQERRLFEHKLQLAMAFAAANGLNRVHSNPSRPRLTLISAGKVLADTRQALAELGYPTMQSLAEAGIRLVQLGLIWPLEEEFVRAVCRDSGRVLVVEEKRGLIEEQLKAHLFHGPRVEVFGKRDPAGELLIPAVGEVTLPIIAKAIARVLGEVPNRSFLDAIEVDECALAEVATTSKEARVPLFCAGCPHNTSTKVPEGSRAAAGIGCHYMAQWMDRNTWTFTHMGGEGANWIGQAPFTNEGHIFVNMGDGTFNHSGLLAIRAAVAAGVNVTYKILFNDAVAMTGGQPMDGDLTVADVVRQVLAEGVRAVRVVTDDPERHAGADYEALPRKRLDVVQQELRDIPGCTALVYEQTCATELRRRRKRGLAEEPDLRVVINDAVCEGCGDCAVQSNCVAVEPLETAFGTKRRINQSACNKDVSCLDGFCPSFVTLRGARPRRREVALPEAHSALPLPQAGRTAANILLTGVGGSGIVTLSQLLAAAAHIDGRHATTLDMTGLAQKGGAVLGHVRISDFEHPHPAGRIPPRGADAVLAADLVTAAGRDVLALFNSERTVVVANTHVAPTAEFLLHRRTDAASGDLLRRLGRRCSNVRTVDADRHTSALLGDTGSVNVFLLGHAFQSGVIPLSLTSLRRAIELNGVAVERNLAAFHYGRMAAHDPDSLPATGAKGETMQRDPDRARYLTAYQNAALADRFERLVQEVRNAEASVARAGMHASRRDEAVDDPGERLPLTEAVAEAYFTLLTPKDEYEVARLYTDGSFADKLAQQFEPGFRLRYHMAPPILSRPGSRRKLALGPWMTPLLRLLARMRPLRGSLLDPFRFTGDRKLERKLLRLYEGDIAFVLAHLDARRLPAAIALARWPTDVRGYGFIKEEAAQAALEGRENLRLAVQALPIDRAA